MKNRIPFFVYLAITFFVFPTTIHTQNQLTNCSNIVPGKFLCASELDDGVITMHSVLDDGVINITEIDRTGKPLSSTSIPTETRTSLEVQDDQLIKLGPDGTILWQKTISSDVLSIHDNIEKAAELSNGEIVLGGFICEHLPVSSEYVQTLVLLKLDENLNLLQQYETASFTYWSKLNHRLNKIIADDDNEFIVFYTAVNPYTPAYYPYLTIKRYNDQVEEINTGYVWNFDMYECIATPCSSYFLKGKRFEYFGNSHYYGDILTWLDIETFEEINELEYGMGSIDFFGSYTFHYFNDKGRFPGNIIQENGISGGIPRYAPLQQVPVSMDFYIDENGIRRSFQTPYIPFEYIVQTSDHSALIFDEEDGYITIYDSNCIQVENCDLIIEMYEVQCTDNDTPANEEDDEWIIDLLVEGDASDTYKIGYKNIDRDYPRLIYEFKNLTYNTPHRIIIPKNEIDYIHIENEGTLTCAATITLEQEGDCNDFTDSRPDLSFSDLSTHHYEYRIGDILSFSFDAINEGMTAATGDFTIKSYLSKDRVLDADDYQDGVILTGNFDAGFQATNVQGAMKLLPNLELTQITNNDDFKYDYFYLILEIDSENTIDEVYEFNNTIVSINGIYIREKETVINTDYCEVSSNFPWEEWISNVQIGSISNESGKAKYSFNEQAFIQLQKGANILWQMEATYSYFTFKEYCSIYIDYNGNGVFENAELFAQDIIYPPADGSNTKGIISGMGTIPFNAKTGEVRMRVLMQRNEYADPCEDLTYGEVEDYVVELVPTWQNFGLIENYVPTINYHIYPNPTVDGLHVDVSLIEQNKVQLQVVDCLGRILFNREVNPRQISSQWIDMTSWNAGYYDLQIIQEGQVVQHEAIVKN